jgi:hypothetical protein
VETEFGALAANIHARRSAPQCPTQDDHIAGRRSHDPALYRELVISGRHTPTLQDLVRKPFEQVVRAVSLREVENGSERKSRSLHRALTNR